MRSRLHPLFGMMVCGMVIALQARAEASIKEIRSKETVRLLAETSIVYETDISAKAGFWIRLLFFRTKGNCEEAEQCATDRLIAVTSAFDEEPEQRAFEIVLTGLFKRVVVVSVPKLESGAFILSLFTSANGQKDECNAYSVSLSKVRYLKTPCP